jgi:CheY-like chemotaxis protein
VITKTDDPIILCVEDEPAHALLLKHALNEIDIKTHFVHVLDGQAALDYVFREGSFSDITSSPTPALIFLDLNVPKVEGIEILKKFKSSPDYADIPVVVMSSSNAPQDVRIAYENHANCYLLKPQGFGDLIGMLKGVVGFWLKK